MERFQVKLRRQCDFTHVDVRRPAVRFGPSVRRATSFITGMDVIYGRDRRYSGARTNGLAVPTLL
jgi:hypothetical protein